MSTESIEAKTSLTNDSEPLFSQTLLAMPSTTSLSTESVVPCRICKGTGGPDLMSTPCHCKGSMGVVHVSCLEEWLRGSTRDSCELCSGTFKIIRTPKYSCCQSIWIFFSNKVSILRLVRDLIFLFVSITNTFILLYLWLIFIIKDIVNVFGNKHPNFESVMVISPVRGLFYLFFFTVCLIFVTLNAVDDCRRIFYWYILPWYNWWQSMVDVKLDLNVDEENTINQ